MNEKKKHQMDFYQKTEKVRKFMKMRLENRSFALSLFGVVYVSYHNVIYFYETICYIIK